MAIGWLETFRQDHFQVVNSSGQDRLSVEQRVTRIQGHLRPDSPGRLDLTSAVNALEWLRLLEVRRSSDRSNDVPELTPTLIALSRLARSCGFIVGGSNGECIVSIGIERGHRKLLQTAVEASLEAVLEDSLPLWLTQPSSQWASLIYSGIPSLTTNIDHHPRSSRTTSVLDQILQTLRSVREQWLFMLLFQPVEAKVILDWQFSVAEQVRRVRIDYRQSGTASSFSRAAQRYEELLEDYLKLLDLAIAEGGWLTYGLAYASPEAIQQVHAALAASFAGPHSRPEAWCLRPPGSGVFKLDTADWSGQLTFLPSSYLAQMACLPEQEHSGIAVSKMRRFDLVPPLEGRSLLAHSERTVLLGKAVDGTRTTKKAIQLDLSVLSRHTFVAGITGSGKSTTVQALVSQAAIQAVKLLVIEPVKREYRRLAIPGLRVFSLGDPGCDLEMNPFAFEGISCSTHMDYLKSLFAASYVLYPPMPYILEQALFEVYRDKGWDLASGLNWRGESAHPRSFPRLTDLYVKVGEVIARSGYGPRLEPEIKAALEVRINNLRIGAKGALLDTSRSLTLGELVSQPTVLELQGIGDPEQRAFLMGLILTKVYEGSIAAGATDRLRMLVVIEEAHRLLEEKPGAGEDFANPQAKAVETFSDLLAELRAYGVGLIIAEQSPSRITRQALKNTATKFVHQLVDATERDLMAGAMILTQDESLELATLPRGQMLLFGEGMNRPMRVAVSPQESAARSQAKVEPVKGDIGTAKLSALTSALQDDPRLLRSTLRMVSTWLFGEQPATSAKGDLLTLVGERMPTADMEESFLRALALKTSCHNLDKIVSQWGGLFGWSFEIEEQVLEELRNHAEMTLKQRQAVPFVDRSRLLDLMRSTKPLAGCRECARPSCLRPFVRFADIDSLAGAINRAGRETDTWENVAVLVEQQAESIVAAGQEVLTAAERCLLAHAAVQAGLTSMHQAQVVSRALLELEADT